MKLEFAVVLALLTSPVAATEVALVGMMGQKALVSIDGGKERILTAGQSTSEGVRYLGPEGGRALFEVNGKRKALTLGEAAYRSSGDSGAGKTVLQSDGQGHFLTDVMINGATVRGLVDTGATYVSMSMSQARSLGIKLDGAPKGAMQTANGAVPAYLVKLQSVKVGDITLSNIDGLVSAGDQGGVVLIGMSFLNRLSMQRDGEKMVLTKRY
ncbi:retropepsin-like aspartic protease [Chitinivorax sp. PXF-14]|uniref:retropepsin-like aspartic protease family protein n=1 Tax=Chitinivorax sp. PXF-14 TaxID=3230488 RepID=UPI0034655B35